MKQLYLHYKTQRAYWVLHDDVIEEATGRTLVVYADEERVYARPYSEFYADVTDDAGDMVPRFRKLEPT